MNRLHAGALGRMSVESEGTTNRQPKGKESKELPSFFSVAGGKRSGLIQRAAGTISNGAERFLETGALSPPLPLCVIVNEEQQHLGEYWFQP